MRGLEQGGIARKKPDTLWVNKRVVKCPKKSRSSWAVEAGSDVFLLKRIRYVDEEAVSIEESRNFGDLIHDVDAIGISLYDDLRSQHIYPTTYTFPRQRPDAGCRVSVTFQADKYRCRRY